MAVAAEAVFGMQGEALGPVADEILGYAEYVFPSHYVDKYLSRVEGLLKMQERFNKHPSSQTLGDPRIPVQREVYNISLLLSMVFSNHRFEIRAQLNSFLRGLSGSGGNIVSIGTGPGYEIKLMSQALPGWIIETYDTDAGSREEATRLLQYFQVHHDIRFCDLFPLDRPRPEFRNRYDAIVLCEVLEHLDDPGTALRILGQCLKDRGSMFVTMAVNIAQEDHVFLYPDINSCRRQIGESGLAITSEWITPQTIFPIPAHSNREDGFVRGNYIAVVQRKR